jgi:hypothetical protein
MVCHIASHYFTNMNMDRYYPTQFHIFPLHTYIIIPRPYYPIKFLCIHFTTIHYHYIYIYVCTICDKLWFIVQKNIDNHNPFIIPIVFCF